MLFKRSGGRIRREQRSIWPVVISGGGGRGDFWRRIFFSAWA